MPQKTFPLLKILTIALFIASCATDRPEVDISQSTLSSEILRLDIDLFENTNDTLQEEDIQFLKDKYGTFYKLFVEGIIAVGNSEDSATTYYLNHFKNDQTVKEIALACKNTFSDLHDINLDFNHALKRYHILFPNKPVPELYGFISAFSYTIVVDDSILGVGLDMYLSNQEGYYDRLGIPKYKKLRMRPEYIVSDAMKSWMGTEFEMKVQNEDLLSYMIYHGKLLYALDLILPNTPDSIKISYSSKQMEWIEDNVSEVWFHFAENDLFYSKDAKQIQKFIGESPFTPGFPEGSPGMSGRWLGWQIVRKYMELSDNPLDLQGLFKEKDAQKILVKSKFKP